jgi:hypothetical protein
MTAFIQKKITVLAIFVALLCASTAPGPVFADDEKDKNTPTEKAAPAKPAAPAAGLTERERMLLDRVEQLEKRVAELETKGTPSATPSNTPTAEVAGADPKVPGADW